MKSAPIYAWFLHRPIGKAEKKLPAKTDEEALISCLQILNLVKSRNKGTPFWVELVRDGKQIWTDHYLGDDGRSGVEAWMIRTGLPPHKLK